MAMLAPHYRGRQCLPEYMWIGKEPTVVRMQMAAKVEVKVRKAKFLSSAGVKSRSARRGIGRASSASILYIFARLSLFVGCRSTSGLWYCWCTGVVCRK